MALSPENEALLQEQIALCRARVEEAPEDPVKRQQLAVLLSDMGTQLKLLGKFPVCRRYRERKSFCRGPFLWEKSVSNFGTAFSGHFKDC